MNKEDILKFVDNIKEDNDLFFVVDGLKVLPRFDKQTKDVENDTYSSLSSFQLYSLTFNTVLIKGVGRIRSKNLQKAIHCFFNNTLKIKNVDSFNVKACVEKAKDAFESFIYDRKKIVLQDILKSFLPVIMINLSHRNSQDSKKIIKLYEQSENTILNLATLYFRSSYHSLLSLPYINQTIFKFDVDDVLNGVIFYDDKLIFASDKNACTLSGFKKIIHDKINSLNDRVDFSSFKTVELLYLVRDTIVGLTL